MARTALRNARAVSPRYDDLVELSTRLFSEHGYDATTVRMIADAMGVKSGSLYSHIDSKNEVLVRIVMSVAEDFFDGAKAASTSAGDAADRLRAMCRAHIEVLDRRQDAVRVYYDEWRKLDPRSRRRIVKLRADYESCFVGVIEQGVAAGAFRVVDVRAAVLVILSACNWTYQWYSRDGQWKPADIADRYIDVIVNGLRDRGSGGPADPSGGA
jgi:AcrR family transcriptional regulator